MGIKKRETPLNKKEAEQQNKANFCEYMERALTENKLATIDNMYVLLKDEVAMDRETGNYLFTEAGQHKSNNRQYINIDGFMCPSYVFRVVYEGLTSENPKHKERYNLYKNGIPNYRLYTKEENIALGYDPKSKMMGPVQEVSVINHVNGNSLDNRDDNLECVSYDSNNKHSRFMSEVAHYFPSLISTEYDCQGHPIHKWIDKIGVSCSQIDDYNKKHPKNQILAFKDKGGVFRSRFTKEEVTEMLQYFGKLQSPQTSYKPVKNIINNKQYEWFDF